MTLDEAIEHAERCADNLCGECAEEHRQLAGWLRELVTLKAENGRLLSENAELKRKLVVLKAHGVEIADAAGGGHEVYNELQRELDAARRSNWDYRTLLLNSYKWMKRAVDYGEVDEYEFEHIGRGMVTRGIEVEP